MNIQTKPLINKLALKFTAGIFGYGLWIALAYPQTKQLNMQIPLYFNELSGPLKLSAPDTLSITVSGKRSDLQKMDLQSLGAFLNLDHLTESGSHQIHLSPKQIFLPNNIKLLDYFPVVINVQLS